MIKYLPVIIFAFLSKYIEGQTYPDASLADFTPKNFIIFHEKEISKWDHFKLEKTNFSAPENADFKSGYKGMAEWGLLFGTGEAGKTRFGLSIINGYQADPHFYIGFGLGVRYYLDTRNIWTPVFADVRINFFDKPSSPFISFNAGYTFDARDSFKDVGLLLKPTVGMSIRVTKKSRMDLGISYEVQSVRVYNQWFTYNHFGGYPILDTSSKTEGLRAVGISMTKSF